MTISSFNICFRVWATKCTFADRQFAYVLLVFKDMQTKAGTIWLQSYVTKKWILSLSLWKESITMSPTHSGQSTTYILICTISVHPKSTHHTVHTILMYTHNECVQLLRLLCQIKTFVPNTVSLSLIQFSNLFQLVYCLSIWCLLKKWININTCKYIRNTVQQSSIMSTCCSVIQGHKMPFGISPISKWNLVKNKSNRLSVVIIKQPGLSTTSNQRL